MKNFLQKNPKDLQNALMDVNRRMQEEETSRKAVFLNLPYIDLHNFPIDLNVLGLVTEAEAKAMEAVPFYLENKELRIGAVDPQHPLLAEKLKELGEKYQVKLYIISPISFEHTAKFYAKVLRPKTKQDDTVRVNTAQDPLQRLKAAGQESAQAALSGSEFLEIILGGAMAYRASDVHFEPEEHFIKLRYRIDGVLQDVLHIAKTLQNTLVTRVKILAKLKLNISDVAQDGRFTFYADNQPIDVRVSSLPSAYGEEFVLRLLGTGAVNLKLSDLGFRSEQKEVIEKILAKPNGMVITTGPTGSGKTTTLYAFLHQLNEPGVKIITLEDPVEYKLEGIVQTPIDHTHDFSFAKGLRAILRQDPDIVMVGEIRDQETAETAMQAALTGHMVLSTLHTNDAAGAVPRLLNMGIKPFVVAPALSAILAQRLVRRLCEFCKKPAVLSPQVMEKVTYILHAIPASSKIKVPGKLEFYHSAGCDKCNGLGYRGRVGIYEILVNTEELQKLIFQNASTQDFKKCGISQGMITMVQDGLLKALEGMTDVEEVFRVAGE